MIAMLTLYLIYSNENVDFLFLKQQKYDTKYYKTMKLIAT